MVEALDEVAAQIARRYAHPGRKAYTYLFRLKPHAPFNAIVPAQDSVLTAWLDEGAGLSPAPIDTALDRCRAVHAIGPDLQRQPQLTSHQRRQLMSRSILFSVIQRNEDVIEVHLISRALAFSPKGDREVTEEWRRGASGWYSAYRPHEG
ncbi:MAG: hypothetical protein IT324_30320 [Anaerolineae bacterium]|nr:hypothetical protein [Anaerolineae bacterium]